MSESKHTPGPWKLNPQPNPYRPLYYSIYIKPAGPETMDHICMVSHQMSENWQANARLIAAAPALLDACNKATAALQIALANLNPGVSSVMIGKLNKMQYEAEAAIAQIEQE